MTVRFLSLSEKCQASTHALRSGESIDLNGLPFALARRVKEGEIELLRTLRSGQMAVIV